MLPTAPAVGRTLPFDPERITENILALSDMAVVLTQGSQNIIYCSQSISAVLGISKEDLLHGGWAFMHSLINQADLKILQHKLFPALRSFFGGMPDAVRDTCTFNYTLRMRQENGSNILLAFENQPMQWTNRHWPEMYMTVIKNITPYGNKQKMISTIARQEKGKRNENIHELQFDFRWEPFTPREVQIIRMVAGGQTSKEIADDLHLSEETIRNHRKHVMRKASCANSAELCALANREGML